ncbi:MAG: hypothetical protein ONB46_16455 [candidate division KSB1 bacterium]|nr:hypothetical protein [candidate division KSB1 bacterium]MDZ7367252.1 hypothetical protein [candidate division KSB1 bacterium]
MFDKLNEPLIKVFPLLNGVMALLDKQLPRLLDLKPLSEVFTNPRFQKSARITGTLGRVFLAIFGIGFLVQGVGHLFFSSKVTNVVSLIASGLSVLIVLGMIGIHLAYWKT